MSRFWLIRHGEPEAHSRGRCYGDLDVGLSEAGRAQIRRAAASLQPVAAVYSSPRVRSLESAQIIAAAGGHGIEVVDDLREINFGDFESRTYDEIAALYPELYRQWMTTPTQVRFPNGESFAEMRARVLAAFDKIRHDHEGQTIAIVSHAGVNRVILAWALQMPDEAIFRLAQDYAACNLLSFVENVPLVEQFNRTAG